MRANGTYLRRCNVTTTPARSSTVSSGRRRQCDRQRGDTHASDRESAAALAAGAKPKQLIQRKSLLTQSITFGLHPDPRRPASKRFCTRSHEKKKPQTRTVFVIDSRCCHYPTGPWVICLPTSTGHQWNRRIFQRLTGIRSTNDIDISGHPLAASNLTRRALGRLQSNRPFC